MTEPNQPFGGNNPNLPDANTGRTYYNPYDGELQSPFSTDLHGNPNTHYGQQRVSRDNRYSTPNETVPLGDPVLPLLLLITSYLLLKAILRTTLRLINLPPSEGKTRERANI